MYRNVHRYSAMIQGVEREVVGAGSFWLAKMPTHNKDEFIWVEIGQPASLVIVGTARVTYNVEDTGPVQPDLESHEYEELDF